MTRAVAISGLAMGEALWGNLIKKGRKVADIKLDAHPESFQLEKNGSRIFVNLPGSRKVAVVDRKTGRATISVECGADTALLRSILETLRK